MQSSSTNFINNLLKNHSLRQHIFYYPGCGVDHGPLVFGIKKFSIAAAIYADYAITKTSFLGMLRHCSEESVGETFSVSPKHLNQHSWDAFWFEKEQSRLFGSPSNAFGQAAWLPSENSNEPTLFVFLRTEAVQTYANLIQTTLRPTIVMLQDHGFGGNWTTFGGEHEMYEIARAHNALPEFLIVAEGTDPWPGYGQESPYEPMLGQMHNYKRAVFRRM
jgi:hypothetical protein